MAPTFSRSVSEQSTSPFFNKLSAELRLEILRHLMLPSAAAQAKGRFVEEDAPDSRPHLSSQSMACCQQLYKECESVVYGENTLRIVLEPDCMTVSDGYLDTTGNSNESSTLFPIQGGRLDFSLAHLAASEVAKEISAGHLTDLSFSNSWISNNIQAALRMRRVEIHIDCLSQRQLWTYVRLLRNVVTDKKVILVWKVEGVTDEKAENLLESLYLWRCKTLSFVGIPDNQKTTADTIRTLTTSSRPVDDLWFEFRTILKCIRLDPAHALAGLILSSNLGAEESDNDDEEQDVSLEARMLEARRQRSRRPSHRSKSLTAIASTNMIWKWIRSGDTSNFAVWKKQVRYLLEQN